MQQSIKASPASAQHLPYLLTNVSKSNCEKWRCPFDKFKIGQCQMFCTGSHLPAFTSCSLLKGLCRLPGKRMAISSTQDMTNPGRHPLNFRFSETKMDSSESLFLPVSIHLKWRTSSASPDF